MKVTPLRFIWIIIEIPLGIFMYYLIKEHNVYGVIMSMILTVPYVLGFFNQKDDE